MKSFVSIVSEGARETGSEVQSGIPDMLRFLRERMNFARATEDVGDAMK